MNPLADLKSLIRRRLAERMGVPELAPALARLRQLGFEPSLIFDVGAYRGEFAQLCRGVWPTSRIVCFEPQPAARLQLEQSLGKDSLISVFQVLLGAEERPAVDFHLCETASSVLEEQVDKSHPVASFPMATIDALVSAKVLQPPEFLKLDVQGYELEVLKGAQESLKHIEVVLAELNFLDLHCGVPLLAEVANWLQDREFVAFDVCSLIRRPLDNALWQADMLFVKKNHSLRADKRWAMNL